MEAYLFSASFREVQGARREWSEELIVHGDSRAQIVACYEDFLARHHFRESKGEKQLQRLLITPVASDMIAETQVAPVDWLQLRARTQGAAESEPADDSLAGYWIAPADCPPAEARPRDLAALQATLDEDLRAGLNWAATPQFCYLLSVFATAEAEEPESAVIVEARNAVAAIWLWQGRAGSQANLPRTVQVGPMPLEMGVADFYGEGKAKASEPEQ